MLLASPLRARPHLLLSACLVSALFQASHALPAFSVPDSSRFIATGIHNNMDKIVPPGSSHPHSATIILMHGLGDTSAGWIDVAHMLSPQLPYAKWILPTATTRPVTLNGGMPMPAWYDIRGLDDRAQEDCEGIKLSTERILSLVANEEKLGIKSNRIVLAGFSQGGAMAIHSAFAHPSPLAGVVSMSGYLVLPHAFTVAPSHQLTPVFHGHGSADNVVKYAWGERSVERLKGAGVKVTFKTYRGMDHTACDEEIRDVLAFLRAALPPL